MNSDETSDDFEYMDDEELGIESNNYEDSNSVESMEDDDIDIDDNSSRSLSSEMDPQGDSIRISRMTHYSEVSSSDEIPLQHYNLSLDPMRNLIDIYLPEESSDDDIPSQHYNLSLDPMIHSRDIDLPEQSIRISRMSHYSEESSGDGISLQHYNPSLDPMRHLRSQSVLDAARNLQSIEPDISQQPSCSTSTQNITEPQTSSASANTNDSGNPEEPFSCSICLDGLTSSGNHRPACLKCGHIFGEHCIERWIKTGCSRDAKRCPTCNTKATVKDIRILYAKSLVVVDTAQITDLQNKLEIEFKKNNELTIKSHSLFERTEHLSNEVEKLRNIVSLSKPLKNAPTSKQSLIKNIKLCKFSNCRVMAYNKMNMMLVVSHTPETALFNKQVIRKMNTTLMIPTDDNIYVHTKQIRDMAFHPVEHNLLASVGLDKCINLIDLMSNTVVSSINVEEPLWSCCWAGDNSNMLVAGGQIGSLYYIDKRFMKVLHSEQIRSPACVSLVSIPPSSTRIFPKGGFLKTRMDLLSMFESSLTPNFYQETELPLKGLWSSASYDPRSNHILLSAKPCGNNNNTRHIVSKMSYLSEDCTSLQPIVTFYGGDKATHLTRSCIVPAKEPYDATIIAYFDEKSNCIQLCSLNSNSSAHKFYVQEPVLDLCYLDGVVMNSRRVIAALSAKSIGIYCV